MAVLLVAGLAGAGYWYQSWNERLGLFDERAHAVRTDLVTLTRGARSDATLISRAFDDADVRSLLRDQADMWADRLKKCDQLHDKLEELIPLNASQTAHEMAIERELAEIQSAARDLSNAAANEDVFTARVAATRLADSNSSGTASE